MKEIERVYKGSGVVYANAKLSLRQKHTIDIHISKLYGCAIKHTIRLRRGMEELLKVNKSLMDDLEVAKEILRKNSLLIDYYARDRRG